MYIPEVFKFGTVLSYPIFTIIALILIRKTSNFSVKKQTVSKSINYLNNSFLKLIFRFNFILKAILDLGFTLYTLTYLNFSLISPIGFIILLSVLFFGALAYFIEGKYSVIHNVLIYSYMTLWVVGHIFIAFSIGNISFTIFTLIFLITPLMIGFWSLYNKTTSVLIQALDLFFVYSWLIVFVFKYL